MLPQVDLFGQTVEKDELLRDKYIEPPFSVLDTKQGSWQKRKNIWRNRGIKSEIGRDENKLKYSNTINNLEESYTGTSIFDPVLCELMYHWFCPKGGAILDPFCGGSVRGIVAHYLGYYYTGIDLSQRQIWANRDNALEVLKVNNQPNWYAGDSDKILEDLNKQYDFIFTCPPYMNLEVYSDDPQDLSTMSDSQFVSAYQSIIKKTCNKLVSGGFACFVVGDVRDKKTGYYKDFITITKQAFYSAGMFLYNEAVLLENGLNTAAVRADKTFTASKKLIKVHQNVLVFVKP